MSNISQEFACVPEEVAELVLRGVMGNIEQKLRLNSLVQIQVTTAIDLLDVFPSHELNSGSFCHEV